MVSSVDAGGTVQARTETRYYDGFTPRLQIQPSGEAERYSHDTKGRLRLTEYLSGDPEASGANPALSWSEIILYDQAGNRIHEERRDAQGHVTWKQDRAYDVQHRVVWEQNPSLPSAGRSWSYAESGFLAGVVDEEGRGTTYVPDGLNRVSKVRRTGWDPMGNPAALDVATYEFGDGQDVLAGVTGGNGYPTSYAYDDFGQIERVSSGTLGRGGGVWYRHDARGNVLERGDSSVTVSSTYDGLDRLVSVSAQNSADGSTVSYQYRYDEGGFAGQVTTVVEGDRTISLAYDWRGKVAAETVWENGITVPLTTQYAYDADGQLQQMTYPSGLTVQLDRDPGTREVVAVRNVLDGTVYASGIVRYRGGPIAGLTFGNGRTLEQTFNQRYEPLGIRSGPIWLSYAPTPSGDIGVVRDQSEDPSGCSRDTARGFEYDLLDRLSGWKDSKQGGVETCSLETIGAMGGAFTYVEGTDQIASQAALDSGQTMYGFGYDFQGNVSAIGQYDAAGSSIASAVCIRHDALGRMVQVGYTSAPFLPGGEACLTDAEMTATLARFKYDARARRIARQVEGQWTYVISDSDGNPLSELALTTDPSNPWTKVRDYVWLDGRLLAQIEYTGAAAGGGIHAYYAHLDHLGFPRALSNQNGQMVWSTFQRPYGEIGERVTVDPLSGQEVVTNLRLPGQYDERLLGNLGLQGPYYNWNRWYLPGMGRYLELDPIAATGAMNTQFGPDWYGYALGNPLAYYDPDGRQVVEGTIVGGLACGPICAGVVFVVSAAVVAIVGSKVIDTVSECAKKKGACSCVCYERGRGPNPIGQKPSAFACKEACNSEGYSGYKCGSDVTWN